MTRFAPTPGTSADFDEIAKKTREGLDAAGNPEGIDDEALREMLARRFAEHGNKTWPHEDEADEVLHKVDVPVAQVRELVVPSPSEPYWYSDPEQAATIRHFILMRRALGPAFHGGLLIVGGAGYGKTLGMAHLVDAMNADLGLGLRLFRMNAAVVTDPQRWFGRREIDRDGSRYETSDFILAIERGDVVQLDEANRIHPTIANSIHSLLDGTQELTLPDLNITVAVHPETVFVATMNLGSQYGGVHRLDQAFRSRFSTTITVGPPPREEEVRVITANTGCDPDNALTLVEIAEASRKMFEGGDLRTEISTRDLVAAGRWIAAGKTLRAALEITVLPMFDGDANGSGVGMESDQGKIKRVVEGKSRR